MTDFKLQPPPGSNFHDRDDYKSTTITFVQLACTFISSPNLNNSYVNFLWGCLACLLSSLLDSSATVCRSSCHCIYFIFSIPFRVDFCFLFFISLLLAYFVIPLHPSRLCPLWGCVGLNIPALPSSAGLPFLMPHTYLI